MTWVRWWRGRIVTDLTTLDQHGNTCDILDPDTGRCRTVPASECSPRFIFTGQMSPPHPETDPLQDSSPPSRPPQPLHGPVQSMRRTGRKFPFEGTAEYDRIVKILRDTWAEMSDEDWTPVTDYVGPRLDPPMTGRTLRRYLNERDIRPLA